ncbi:MAG: hypothetical protein FWE48_07020 [Coriobacteriia bacterium]|nr:hypothetical protein [Coriobacteriia bacterium]MCL2871304.1 hypothetical protein [Coriobacteriia bacterium]
MSQASRYLDALTHTIGPRPASSDTERQAAEWLQSQFTEAGVATELQDFDAPRSPQSARMLTYLAAPIAVFGIGASFLEQMWVIHWACWLLLAAMAVLTLLDMYGPKGPAGLISLLPKGPSQNVIAKSIPSSYSPGETPKKVVLVANYDTELTSPLSGEATSSIYRIVQLVANLVVVLMPLLVLLLLLNPVFLRTITDWIFYALLALCIPGMVLIGNQLIARVMNRYSPGANNNASGVAAMLVAAEKLDEGQQGHSGHTMTTTAIKLAAAEAKVAEAAKQSSKMPGVDYKPVGATSAATAVASVPASSLDLDPEKAPLMTASFESVGVTVEEDPQADYEKELATEADSSAPSEDLLNQGQPDKGQPDGNKLKEESEPVLQDPPTSVPVRTDRLSEEEVKERFVDFETVEFSSLGDDSKVGLTTSYAALEDYDAQATFADAPELGTEMLDANIIGAPVGEVEVAAASKRNKQSRKTSRSEGLTKERRVSKEGKPKKKRSFFGFGKKNDARYEDDPSNWLGLGDDFNARKEGKAIGSWDNFGEGAGAGEGVVDLTDSFAPIGGSDSTAESMDLMSEPPLEAEDGVVDLTDSFAPLGGPGGEDDDHFAWKGGFAGDDPIEDDSYASAEAARIRRKVLDSLDVELKEKEVWFVATGAHYGERAGIRAFMNDYGDELRGALFINISAVGAGDLYWSTKEHAGKTYQSSARLTSMLRRLSRESHLRIKPWKKTLISDAGPILAAGRKAVTLTRLTDKGVPFALASQQDTAARLDSSKIDEAADLVCSIIREVS